MTGVQTCALPIFSPELVSVLKRWKLRCPVNKWGLVFSTEDGRPIPARKWAARALVLALREANSKPGAEQIPTPLCGHSFVPCHLNRGDDVVMVSQSCGHATVAFTMNRYFHFIRELKKNINADFGKFIVGENNEQKEMKEEKAG